jgi:hypothetical protein
LRSGGPVSREGNGCIDEEIAGETKGETRRWENQGLEKETRIETIGRQRGETRKKRERGEKEEKGLEHRNVQVKLGSVVEV